MQKLSLRSRGWRPARTMNAPDASAPWLARSNAARSSSGDVQHFNPLVNSLVNPPSRSSWAAAKPLQPLSPRSGALIALARSGAVRTPFGAEAAPHRAKIASCHLSPLCVRTAALTLLERGQDGSWCASSGTCCNASRTTDQWTESSQSLATSRQPDHMRVSCIAAAFVVAAEAVVRRESATSWSYAY